MDKVIRHGLEISAGLDKASQKEMRQAIRDIFVEEAHIDFNNPENVKGLRALADIMKKMFQQAGNAKFDFSKMIELPGPELFDGLKEAAMEFDSVWTNIVSKFGKQSLKDVFMRDQSDLSMALSRLTNKDGQIVQARIKNIQKAFKEVKIADINKLLNEAMGVEEEFRLAESWEEQTAAALRYLNVYERIKEQYSKGAFTEIDIERSLLPVYKNIDKLGDYSVSMIRDVVPQMQTSLQNIFNLALGKPLIGLTEGGRVDFEVVPTVIKTLDISDVLGGKQSIEVPVAFKAKLDLMRDLSEVGDFEQLEKLQDEIVSMFPADMQDVILSRLEKFAQAEKITARSYQAIYKDLIGYGMSADGGPGGFGVGDGSGSGGDGDGPDLGDGIGPTPEDIENTRKVAELAERIEDAYKKLESFPHPWGDIKDTDELNRIYEERLEIIRNIGEENLKAHDPTRYKDYIEEWNESFEHRNYLAQLDADGEVYEKLDSELDYNNEIIVSSEKLEALLANRQALMKDINLTSEEEYLEQEEINKQIERRIALQKELEPLVAKGTLSQDDYEDILAERGELEERQKQLGGIQQNLFNAEPEDLNEAQSVLDQYERILVKTASGKTLTLGPEMSEEDWKSFMKIDTDKVKSIEFVRKAIQQETNDINTQNNALQENASLKGKSGVDGSSGQTDGATTEEIQNLEAIRAKVSEITTAVEAKTNAFKTEGVEVGNVVDSEIAKLEELENKVMSIKATLEGLLNNIKTGADDVGAGLSNITVNVNHQKNEEDKGASIDKDALKQTLGEVIYKVKITRDDNDKSANKVAINESDLEAVLKRVFTKELAPQADINNVENALSAIKTATESVDKKIVRGTKTVIGGEDVDTKKKPKAVEGRDAQILAERIETQKLALKKFKTELITSGKMTDDVAKKIRGLAISLGMVKDSKGLTRWGEKFKQQKLRAGIEVVENKDTVIADKQTDAEKVKLEKQYKELGVLQAREEVKRTEEAKVRVTQLQQEIAEKQESLKLSEQELEILRQITEEAKADELDVLGAKKDDKDEKKRLADAKKLAKRQAMTGKASSAISRAEGVWLEAEGLEQAKLPEGFKKQVSEYYDVLDKLRLKHHEVNTSEVVTEQQQNELIKQTAEVNRLTNEVGELVAEYQKLSGSNVDETNSRATTLTGQSGLNEYETALKQYVREITNGKGQIKSFNAETKTLTYTVKTGKNEFTEYTAAVRNLDHQLVSVQGTTNRTETFFEATARKMKELTSYFSGMAVFNRIGQELRRGIQYVREIDLALTELKKVTDETEESYDRFLETAAKTGARLGSTISAVTEATATFAKLGYTMEQATEMAESAIVYKNVGDNIASTEDAADSIISTMKGFKLEATESMRIVDRFNEVGNRFAITSQGIGEALRLSASALSEGGNSLDESIGLITAANEVVNDPSSVGKNKLADIKSGYISQNPEVDKT